MDRRTTLKWVLAAAATIPALAKHGSRASPQLPVSAEGYGTDPDLAAVHRGGEFWPLLLTEVEKRTARVLCDLIIPADAMSPSASAVGVVDFIDEWVSAPYAQQSRDRPIIRRGLAWMNLHSRQRFQKDFANLGPTAHHAICDAICDIDTASPDLRSAAEFFARFRLLTAGGFYSTPIGRKDLGYIGNVALASFEGPPQALLDKLGLA